MAYGNFLSVFIGFLYIWDEEVNTYRQFREVVCDASAGVMTRIQANPLVMVVVIPAIKDKQGDQTQARKPGYLGVRVLNLDVFPRNVGGPSNDDLFCGPPK